MKPLPALAAALALAACSAAPETAATNAPAPVEVAAANSAAATPLPPKPGPAEAPAKATPADQVLGLEGLGDLRIGQPVPKGSSWGERGAQIDDSCRTVSSPDYPGAYAIVSGGTVRRITIGQRSSVKLAEGFGIGATERAVREFFAGFREEPHKYEEAPAKYLTAPNAANGSSALRFEIGQDGKVSLIHVGTMPELGYVEGCS